NRLGEGVAADMEGVLDALGCERVVVLDLAMAFPSILFGATHPERTQALVLHNPMARLRHGPDYPQGAPDEFVDGLVQRSRLGEWARLYLSPALAGNERFVRWWERCTRLSMTPTHVGGARARLHLWMCAAYCQRFMSRPWCVYRGHRLVARRES